MKVLMALPRVALVNIQDLMAFSSLGMSGEGWEARCVCGGVGNCTDSLPLLFDSFSPSALPSGEEVSYFL